MAMLREEVERLCDAGDVAWVQRSLDRLSDGDRSEMVPTLIEVVRRRLADRRDGGASDAPGRDPAVESRRLLLVGLLLEAGRLDEAMEEIGEVEEDDAIEAAKAVLKYCLHRAVPAPSEASVQLNLLASRLQFDSVPPYGFLRRALGRPTDRGRAWYAQRAAALLDALVRRHAAAAREGGPTGRRAAAVYYVRLLEELAREAVVRVDTRGAWRQIEDLKDRLGPAVAQLLRDHDLGSPWESS